MATMVPLCPHKLALRLWLRGLLLLHALLMWLVSRGRLNCFDIKHEYKMVLLANEVVLIGAKQLLFS